MPIAECKAKFWCKQTLSNALSSSKIFLTEVMVKINPCANFFQFPLLPANPESLTPLPWEFQNPIRWGVVDFFWNNPFCKKLFEKFWVILSFLLRACNFLLLIEGLYVGISKFTSLSLAIIQPAFGNVFSLGMKQNDDISILACMENMPLWTRM